jgi:glutamyl-tRNA synthetase
VAERHRRRENRPAAVRLRAGITEFTVTDELCGEFTGTVDDFVLRRGDATPAYNLAVVVDDAAQGVDQIVRGNDLLASSPRQAYLMRLLGLPVPSYAHVPLVLNHNGQRLAKRDGAVTLSELATLGQQPAQALAQLGRSLGLTGATPRELLAGFDYTRLSRKPWIFPAPSRSLISGP